MADRFPSIEDIDAGVTRDMGQNIRIWDADSSAR